MFLFLSFFFILFAQLISPTDSQQRFHHTNTHTLIHLDSLSTRKQTHARSHTCTAHTHTHPQTNGWMHVRKERLCVSECTIVRILHTAHHQHHRRRSILNMPHQHKSSSSHCLQQQSSGPTLSMCVCVYRYRCKCSGGSGGRRRHFLYHTNKHIQFMC